LLDVSGATGLQAVLVGGFHGSWYGLEDAEQLPLDDRTRAAGVVFGLDRDACAPMEIVRAIRWLADQSAGQCGPCANGMPAIAALLERSVVHRASVGARAQLERWSADLIGRGACHLPDGAMRFLRTGLTLFAEEFADHFRHGRCERCALPSTLVPASAQLRAAA
jgi:NADH:ubiquinone oxidoreductase subunit F (NADH-binding)